jgi:hypothetical protein
VKSVTAKLAQVQSEINVPKNQRNSFGNYNYRSMEDIATALKPFVEKLGVVFTCQDEMIVLGDRFYVKATAIIVDVESGESLSNTAFAREDEKKRGMDGSQITGAASSYARKYAMNGLLLIDDVKDADTRKNDDKPRHQPQNQKQQMNDGYRNQQQQQTNPGMMSKKQYGMIWALANEAWTDEDGKQLHNEIISKKVHEVGEKLMLSSTSKEWTIKDASAVIKELQEIIKGNELPEGFGGY